VHYICGEHQNGQVGNGSKGQSVIKNWEKGGSACDPSGSARSGNFMAWKEKTYTSKKKNRHHHQLKKGKTLFWQLVTATPKSRRGGE